MFLGIKSNILRCLDEKLGYTGGSRHFSFLFLNKHSPITKVTSKFSNSV